MAASAIFGAIAMEAEAGGGCATRIAKVELPPVSEILGSESVGNIGTRWSTRFPDKKWRSWEELRSGREFTDSNDALGFHIPGAF